MLVLNPGLPLVADQPASDEVVIVSVEDVLAPLLSLEALEEVVAGENLGSVSAGASRHAGSAAVDVVGGGDLEVATLNVGRTKPVEDTSGPVALPDALNSLAGADTTDLGVLEGSENPGHEGRGPGNIVVGHDGDLGGNLGKSLADLETLVRDRSGEDLDIGVRKAASELLESGVLLNRGDEHQNVGFACQNAEQRRAKLLEDIVNGGNDDSDILGSEGRLSGDGLGFIGPVTDAVDKETGVAMNPGLFRQKMISRRRQKKKERKPSPLVTAIAGDNYYRLACLPKGDEQVHPGSRRPAKAEIRQEEVHDGGHGDVSCSRFVWFTRQGREQKDCDV